MRSTNEAGLATVYATATERAAGEAAEIYQDSVGMGLTQDELQTLREEERAAWKQHHQAATEATRRFLQQAQRGTTR